MSGRIQRFAVIALFVFTVSGALYAEEENGYSWWNLKVGSRGGYSNGISESYSYYSFFGEGSMKAEWAEVSFAGTRLLDYQISSGLGEYDYITAHQGSVAAKWKPYDFFSAGGSYLLAKGESSFDMRDWSAYLCVGPDDFNVEVEYGVGNKSYSFNGVDVDESRTGLSIYLSKDISDAVSVEIGYDRSTLELSNLGYEYVKQTGRAGGFFDISDSVMLIGGISGGRDSADYTIAGGDAGIIVVLFSHLKLSGMYFFEQYFAPSSTSTTSTKKGSSGGGGVNSGNPYMSSDKIGESFPSHRISVSLVYSVN